jgi:hypothetical protein
MLFSLSFLNTGFSYGPSQVLEIPPSTFVDISSYQPWRGPLRVLRCGRISCIPSFFSLLLKT